MSAMLMRGALVVGVAGALGALSPSTSPAPGDSAAQLDQCMNHCRDTYTAIEDALRVIEQAQASHDPVELNAALRRVGGELIEMRGRMSSCMRSLEQVRNPSVGTTQPALLAQVWACPMHTQIRQDRPGNCPLCDATLKAVADGPLAPTRPALAASPEHTDRVNQGSLRPTAGR